MVNRAGKRFVSELTTRDAASAAILQQTGAKQRNTGGQHDG